MEGADRALGIELEIVEERRLVAGRHALEDRQVQFQHLLDGIEDAPHAGRLRRGGERFDVAVGGDVEVEFRPDLLDHPRQGEGGGTQFQPAQRAVQDGAQNRCVMNGAQGEALGGDHRLDGGIDEHGAERVLEAADDHRFIDEEVLRPPQPAELGRHGAPA